MFNKLTLYRIQNDVILPDIEKIAHLVTERGLYTPCKSGDLTKSGFTTVGPSELVCYSVENGRYSVLEFKIEKKVIPPQEVSLLTQERIDKAQLRLEKKRSKDEKDQIKLVVTKEMAKQAFSRYTTHRVIFFNQLVDGIRVIGIEATKNQAENIITKLRLALGSLPVTPLTTDTPTSKQLKSILLDDNRQFIFSGNCTLESDSTKSEIRFKNRE